MNHIYHDSAGNEYHIYDRGEVLEISPNASALRDDQDTVLAELAALTEQYGMLRLSGANDKADVLLERINSLIEKFRGQRLPYNPPPQPTRSMSKGSLEAALDYLQYDVKRYSHEAVDPPKRGAYEIASDFQMRELEGLARSRFGKALSDTNLSEYKSLLQDESIQDLEQRTRAWMEQNEYNEL